jgi:signal transduction protein with GAF and PtsI domain
MADFDTSILKLVGLSNFLEPQSDQEDSLKQMAAMAANLLDSENCSIMLLKQDDDGDQVMKVFASHGYLPAAAFTEKARHKEGITGKVTATGKALMVNDIEHSPYAPNARWPQRKHKGFMVAPVFIGQKVLGVVNINTPNDDRCYADNDLFVLTTAALLVGKSIQVFQLQKLLESRFAQLALLEEAQGAVSKVVAYGLQNPAQMSKAFGKAFYREMQKAGFSQDHIISAATEVISMLGETLNKHQKRKEGTVAH